MLNWFLDLPPMFWVSVAFIAGACAGSFANVCIHRMPLEASIVTPPSRCPACGQLLCWYDNIPLVSWLMLGARCRTCSAPISVRYPIVEMLTGAVFALVVWRFGMTPASLVYCVLGWSWVALSGIDWDHEYIPDEINITGMVLGPIVGVLAQFSPWTTGLSIDNLLDALIGLCVGGGVIWTIRFLGTAALKQEAMGFGDVKLMAFIGSFLGWNLVLLGIFFASLAGSVVGLTIKYIVMRGEPNLLEDKGLGYPEAAGSDEALESSYTRIPFGPYLAAGSFVALLWGEQIWEWYWSGLGAGSF